MDMKQTNRAVTVATIWGAIMAVFSLLSAVWLLTQGGDVPFNPGVQIPWNPFYQIGNTVLVAILVFGLYKKSLFCAVVLIVNTVARTAYIIIATGHIMLFLPIISIALYVWAVCGIISLKQQCNIQTTTGAP